MLIIDDSATLPALDRGIVFFSTFVVVEQLAVTFTQQRHLCDGEDCIYWRIDSRHYKWLARHRDIINTARIGRPQRSAELKDLTHSFESGVLEQGNMENMQGGAP